MARPGGLPTVDRFKRDGITATKAGRIQVAARDVRFPGKGLLAHPREHLFDAEANPKDRALVDAIKVRFREDKPLGIRDDGTDGDGKRILTLIFGSRRLNAALVAEREKGEEGTLGDGALMVPVVVLTGSDAEMLEERLRENCDPDKVPDTLRVLAATFCQLLDAGRTAEQIAERYGHNVTPAIVDAVMRAPDLDPADLARFDCGEAPLEILPVVLDVARSERSAMLTAIVGAGAKSARKAQAVVRKATGKARERGRVLPRVVLSRQLEALPKSDCDHPVGAARARGEASHALVLAGFRYGLRHALGDREAAEILPTELQALLVEAARPRAPGPKPKAARS